MGGARIRMYYTAKALSQRHDVDLLVIDEEPVDQGAIDKLQDTFRNVQLFSYYRTSFYGNIISNIVSKQPLQVSYFDFPEISNWIDKNHSEYDLIYCYLVRAGQYAIGRECPCVVDFADALSKTYQQRAQYHSFPKNILYQYESHRLRQYEKLLLESVEQTLVTTQSDQSAIPGEQDIKRPAVVPNGVKPELLEKQPAEIGDGTDLVFLGKMDYFPNVDAATHFAKKLFPEIKQEVPDTTFTIVGSNPPKKVRDLGQYSGVKVTGYVDDPSEYLRNGDIVVVPLRYGSGIQNKVLEAMAVGRPVVTTPLAADGICGKHGRHFYVEELDVDFVRRIVDLFNSPESRRVGRSGRELVESRYTWEEISPTILEYVDDLIT
ncbi:glycosyltransferase [Haloarcula marismortui]|uniref:glycosyltransferase n=1 Tax=Haloarcula marismortui TaxID=2238 RepID=UPI003C77C44D